MLCSGTFVVGNSALQGTCLHKRMCLICFRTDYDFYTYKDTGKLLCEIEVQVPFLL